MKLNLNSLLILLGIVAEMAPDLTGLSVWLSSIHVGWLTHVAHGVGVVALACAGLSRALPKLRPLLSSLGLATTPGGTAPGTVAPVSSTEAPTKPTLVKP
jgi:hypothetical protein